MLAESTKLELKQLRWLPPGSRSIPMKTAGRGVLAKPQLSEHDN